MTDIYHSGIKGQKKGVRRYQYMNGTYTKAGNERYRPSKGIRVGRVAKTVGIGSLLGQAGLIAAQNAKAKASTMTVESVIASLKSMPLKAAATKAAAAKALYSIPAPVYAMSLPILAIGGGIAAGYAIYNLDKIKDVDWQKTAKKAISIGSSTAGVVLSSISGNPLPAVAGISISALMSIKDEEY